MNQPVIATVSVNYGQINISIGLPHLAHKSKIENLRRALHEGLYIKYSGMRQDHETLQLIQTMVSATAPLYYLLNQLNVRIA